MRDFLLSFGRGKRLEEASSDSSATPCPAKSIATFPDIFDRGLFLRPKQASDRCNLTKEYAVALPGDPAPRQVVEVYVANNGNWRPSSYEIEEADADAPIEDGAEAEPPMVIVDDEEEAAVDERTNENERVETGPMAPAPKSRAASSRVSRATAGSSASKQSKKQKRSREGALQEPQRAPSSKRRRGQPRQSERGRNERSNSGSKKRKGKSTQKGKGPRKDRSGAQSAARGSEQGRVAVAATRKSKTKGTGGTSTEGQKKPKDKIRQQSSKQAFKKARSRKGKRPGETRRK